MPDIELIDVPNIHWPASCTAIGSTPPASPSTGTTYIVGASPTGAWAGHENAVAWFGADGAWHFQTPFTGRRVYVSGLTAYRQWNGSSWVADAAGFLPAGGATGQVLTKLSATDGDATWQTPASGGGGPPTGSASGDLSASYPNPTVVAVHSGGTMLSIGAIADGQMLVRSGGTIASQAVPQIVYGTTAGTAAQGNDSRLSDDRPANGLRTASGLVSVSTAVAPAAGQALVATSPTSATWQTISGGGGGGDITAVVAGTGLSGGASSGDATLSVVYGSTAGTSAQGNDGRLSDARVPTAHAASHADGAADELNVTGLSGVLADAQRANVIAAAGGNLSVGTITDGQMLVRSGSSISSQAIPSGGGGAPSGAASGDLGGSYPAPTVVGVHSGATALAIGSIADGQMLVRSGAAIISQAIPSGGGGGSPIYTSFYQPAPAAPHALDDEFASGSPDLAVRGWTVVQYGTSTPMTYAGPLDPYGVNALASGTYRATLTHGGLMIRSNGQLCAYKAISGSFAVAMIINWSRAASFSEVIKGPAIWEQAVPTEASGATNRWAMHTQDGVGATGAVAGNRNAGHGATGYGTAFGSGSTIGSSDVSANWIDWINDTKIANSTTVDALSGRIRLSYGPVSFPGFVPSSLGFVIPTTPAKAYVMVRAFRVYPQGTWPGL